MFPQLRRIRQSISKHGVLGTAKLCHSLASSRVSRLVPRARISWAIATSGRRGIVREIQGSLMKLDLSDIGISRELFLTGVHEKCSTIQYKEEVRPGMVVLEVGANIGYYTLIAAQRIRPNGSVIALEPSPANIESLRCNLKLNDISDMVRLFPVAAGRNAKKLPFYVMPKGNVSGFVKRDGNEFIPKQVIEVQVAPIDQLLTTEGLRYDYFRMDVEGYEPEVIEGMVDTLTGDSPPVGGFIEVHSQILNEHGRSARLFLERMHELGYRIKTARYRGRADTVVRSNAEFYDHPLAEVGYWEVFFARL